MRIKLDENLPRALVDGLRQLGHDADTVVDEGLKGATDPRVWDAVQRDQRFLITQDLDFSDVRKFAPGTHCGLLLVRLTAPSRRRLEEFVVALFNGENVTAWSGCLVVASDTKVRVRKAPSGGTSP